MTEKNEIKKPEREIIIDASHGVLGRIAAFAAKQILLGKKVVIVNCNDAIIVGKRDEILGRYREKRGRGGSSLKGPHFPKSPERIMKRTIRGMIPYKKGRGAVAFKRVMCYNQVPDEFKEKEKTSLIRDLRVKAIKLSEIERLI